MPPSGTTAGMEPDRPAALRLPVLGGARRKERRPDKACMPPSGINGALSIRTTPQTSRRRSANPAAGPGCR
ncbi:hypothetical protein CK506_17205 [Klebsiella pneumoniae]|nr:hypothetical protein CK506_17205 [Klebsiella pneumoniae]